MTNGDERWLPIPGHETRYEVSSFGRVRSKDITIVAAQYGKYPYTRVTKGRILKQGLRNTGYYYVAFNNGQGGKLSKHSIHRVVAETFIPNPLGLTQVNHIDGNKRNNMLHNLEWVTQSGNTQHAYDTGLLKPAFNRRGKTGDMNKTNLHVQQWTPSGEFVKEFESIALTLADGFTPSSVGKCAKGELKQHKNFIWKYPDTESYKALFTKMPVLQEAGI